ncbi:hypothetical protein EJB05_14161, partial [Eragrostis curvula]
MPHGSSEDILPADKSSAVAEICDEEKHCLHTDITLEELKDTMLPKAKDYFHQNIEAAIYQMLWRSKHGAAYVQVKKASMEKPGARRAVRRSRKTALVQLRTGGATCLIGPLCTWGLAPPLQLRDQELECRTHMIAEFLNS